MSEWPFNWEWTLQLISDVRDSLGRIASALEATCGSSGGGSCAPSGGISGESGNPGSASDVVRLGGNNESHPAADVDVDRIVDEMLMEWCDTNPSGIMDINTVGRLCRAVVDAVDKARREAKHGQG